MKKPDRDIAIKVTDSQQSKHVQETFFSLGASWALSDQEIVEVFNGYSTIRYIFYSAERNHLAHGSGKNIKGEEILSYEEFFKKVGLKQPMTLTPTGRRKLYYFYERAQ